jgi:hypothetical protein
MICRRPLDRSETRADQEHYRPCPVSQSLCDWDMGQRRVTARGSFGALTHSARLWAQSRATSPRPAVVSKAVERRSTALVGDNSVPEASHAHNRRRRAARLGGNFRPNLLADIGGAMIPAMGRDRGEQATPDLFSTEMVRDGSPSPIKPIPATQPTADASSQRHVLPKNLRKAVKHLSDAELDLLHAATLEEMGRRGRLGPSVQTTKPSARMGKSSSGRQVEAATVSLTRGQVNAVRAALKAGIKPSLIARQFGISQSDVRKVLASDAGP